VITKAYIDEAIAQADSGLPTDIPIIKGMSSDKIRRLLNHLCRPAGTNYLEIGVYSGSTFIPALWKNEAEAACIDSWTLYSMRRAVFEANLAEHLPGRAVNIVEGDLFTVDLELLRPGVNVYFYDGDHTEDGQYQAFYRFDPVLACRFVALVDDWNQEAAQVGTQRAFADLEYDVEAEWTLPTRFTNDAETWWNGLYVAIINKEKR